MIPKIIHYCWLSNDPYPEKIRHCLNSWHHLLPDYEFVLWDTNRFSLEDSEWVKEAYEAKRYAFAADYIRLYAIYNYGGVYLDSDVEVKKKFDDLLHLPYFICKESYDYRVEVAAFGAEKGTTWVKECLDYYKGRHFVNDKGYDLKVMPDIVQEIVLPKRSINFINSIDEFIDDDKQFNVFPSDWFCANVHLNPTDKEPTYVISSNTYCIHHFASSWVKLGRLKLLVLRILSLCGLYKNRRLEWR